MTETMKLWRERDGLNFNKDGELVFEGTTLEEVRHAMSCGFASGGMKQTGYGKDMSMYGRQDYVVVRHVLINHG